MDARSHEDKGTRTMLSDSPKRLSVQNLPAVSISSPESLETTGVAPVTTPGTLSPSMPAPSPSATPVATSDGHAPPTLPEKDRPVSFASGSGAPSRLSPPPPERTRTGSTSDRDRTPSVRTRGDRPISTGILDTDARGMPVPLPLSYVSTGGAVSPGGSRAMSPNEGRLSYPQQQPYMSPPSPNGPQRMDSYMSDSRFSTMGPPHQGAMTPNGGGMTPHSGGPQMLQRGLSFSRDGGAPHSRGIDWIVPTRSSTLVERRETVAHRLNASLELAKKRHLSCKAKAMLYGRALNTAIGIQVAIGALITGLAAITTGRQTSIMTSVLGALSTMIGTFLARMRGSTEPDRSKSRAKGYDQYIRSVEQYIADHGEELGRDHMDKINEFRKEFEELEGSMSAEQQGSKTEAGNKA